MRITKKQILIGVLVCLILSISLCLNIPFFMNQNTEKEKTVVLFFDDGWENQFSVAYPILELYDFHATFGIVTDSIGDYPNTQWAYMTNDQIEILYQSGMEIASHSVTHRLFHISELSYEEKLGEIVNSKDHLENLGIMVKTFIVPYDECNFSDLELISQFYDSIRPLGETIWITNQSEKEFSSLIYNGVFICYHHINEGKLWATSPSLFHSHMKYLYDNGYRVISFQEYKMETSE